MPDLDASISNLHDAIAALPPDAMQPLMRIPHAVTRILHAVTRPSCTGDRLAEVEDLQEVVNDQLLDLLEDLALALLERSEDLTAEDWYRLFSGIDLT